jgi:ubiquinone/menaquinone biosynthesis C-methylase UbiE
MIKNEIKIRNKNGLSYLYKNSKKIKYKPWLGDLFSFLYDSIMKKSIFPKKFDASIEKHIQFLKNELKDVHNNTILELATGSGNLSEILPSDNKYIGTDISEGLLKIAYKKFSKNNFKDFELFVCSAEELPFQDEIYDICICNLSLNFFGELDGVVKEVKRVLKDEGVFICSVPVPEKNEKKSVIRGTLLSENEMKELFERNGFNFTLYKFTNGTLLYFKAIMID